MDRMTERDLLEKLLQEVKQKIRMLDAIEERLFLVRDFVTRSSEIELLDNERESIKEEINKLLNEIVMLNFEKTVLS